MSLIQRQEILIYSLSCSFFLIRSLFYNYIKFLFKTVYSFFNCYSHQRLCLMRNCLSNLQKYVNCFNCFNSANYSSYSNYTSYSYKRYLQVMDCALSLIFWPDHDLIFQLNHLKWDLMIPRIQALMNHLFGHLQFKDPLQVLLLQVILESLLNLGLSFCEYYRWEHLPSHRLSYLLLNYFLAFTKVLILIDQNLNFVNAKFLTGLLSLHLVKKLGHQVKKDS